MRILCETQGIYVIEKDERVTLMVRKDFETVESGTPIIISQVAGFELESHTAEDGYSEHILEFVRDYEKESQPLTVKTFRHRMESIAEQAWESARKLVQEAQAQHGLGWDTKESVPFDVDSYDKVIDRFATLTGWIYDRMQGKNRFSRGSMEAKIRKVLGYNG